MAVMTALDWTKLVRRYAPRVYLAKSAVPGGFTEDYFPSSVNWFFRNCTLRKAGDPNFVQTTVTGATLATYSGPEYYLLPNSESVYAGDLTRMGAWPMYAHIRNAKGPTSIEGNGWIDIQYWFFYPYNGGVAGGWPFDVFGSHEGDWEHVTVRVADWRNIDEASADNIKAVFYAAHTHSEGKWLVKRTTSPCSGAYELTNGTSPMVWSAWHTHASYENPGTQRRLVIGVVPAHDVTSSGTLWVPPGTTDGVTILKIDDDVYQNGDTQIAAVEWLNFKGRWGNPKTGAPEGPAQKDTWFDDGANGYYTTLAPVGGFGNDSTWGTSRGTTAVAFGVLPIEETAMNPLRNVLGVGLGSSGTIHFQLFRNENDSLTWLADGGTAWPSSSTCTGVALGVYGGAPTLAVARSDTSANTPRFELYTWASGSLSPPTPEGSAWDAGRSCTAIAMGSWAGQGSVGVGLNAGSGPRFEVYVSGNNPITGGEGWPTDCGCKAIAFGMLEGKALVGVAKDKGGGNTFEVYVEDNGKPRLLGSGGSHWGDSRVCTAIAFGVLGDQIMVAVGRSSGDNDRFELYPVTPDGLGPCITGGTAYKDALGVTGLAFGEINGAGVLMVSVSVGSKSSADRIYMYQLENGALSPPKATYGNNWGANRNATCIAAGVVEGHQLIGFGRNAGDHSKGGVLRWI